MPLPRHICTTLVIGALAICQHPARAQTLPVVVDEDLTVGAGATLANAAGLAVELLEARVIPVRLFAERGAARRAGNIAYRSLRLLYFDAPQEAWLLVASHEVLGHGGRIRELFGGVLHYHIDAPPPYGSGGGVTVYRVPSDVTVHDLQAVSIAGMEVNSVAAEQIAGRAFVERRISPRTALRYLGFELDVFDYIQSTGDEEERPGHDVGDFLEIYNIGADGAGGDPLEARTLRRMSYLSLANPMLASAVVAVARHLASGAADGPVFDITVGDVRIMPALRYRFAPFGPELAVASDVTIGSRTGQVSVRVGRAPRERPFGVGVAYSGLRLRNWDVDVMLEGWRQPPLARGATADFGLSIVGRDLDWGGRIRARAETGLAPVWWTGVPLTLIVDAGVKSNGFAPGEPIEPGLVLRAGLGVPLGR